MSNTFEGKPTIITETRFLQLIEAEKRLQSFLAAHPKLEKEQKLTTSAKKYKAAFEEFYETVTQVLWSDEVKHVFTVAHLNGQEYQGKSLDEQILKAKKILGKK